MIIISIFYIKKKILTKPWNIIKKELGGKIIIFPIPPEKVTYPIPCNGAGNACNATNNGKFEGIAPASKGKRN